MFLKDLYHYYLINKSGLFDRANYLLNYPDVRKADIDPLWHFVRIGWKEGRNPSPNFDTDFYLLNNRDVAQAGINPILHYILYGKDEHRSPNIKKPGSISGKYDFTAPVKKQCIETRIFITSHDHQNQPEIKSNKDFREKKQSHLTINMDGQTSTVPSDNIKQFDDKISIIIPTKNAGEEFDFLLKMLNVQKGIQEIEIIVVDSGSTDDTISIAKLNQAKVVEIYPEEFSHSFSRNLGAQTASGDFLLFTVQDALPPNKTWLHSLLSALKGKDVSAVSCAELPRENADLFYRVISWNHYNFLGVNESDRIMSMPDNPNHIQLRKNGQLSDLACLIKRDLFDQYQYRLSYAEDLDLGIRLIKDGHKLAFLGTTRVIHSHNRPAFYFLKRGYVDNVFLSEVFTDYETPKLFFANTVRDIIFMFHFISNEICKKITEIDFPVNISHLKEFINHKLNSADNYKYPKSYALDEVPYIDSEMVNFISSLAEYTDSSMIGNYYNGLIANGLLGYINLTFDYLSSILEFVDRNQEQEIENCLMKELAIISGSHLAHAYRNDSENERTKLSKINAFLKQGI